LRHFPQLNRGGFGIGSDLLTEIINFDEADAGAAVLAAEDGGVIPRGQGGDEGGL
jgi:hypothetical protein